MCMRASFLTRLTRPMTWCCRCLLALAVLGAAAQAQDNVTILRAARLLDVKTGRYVQNPTIVVEGQRIKEITFGGSTRNRAGTIDLGTMTLLPGLIDFHTHLLSDYDPDSGDDVKNGLLTVARMSSAQRALLGAKIAREVLDAGITTVRDLGNSGRNLDVALRDAICAGWVVGPRMVVSTRIISPIGGSFRNLAPVAPPLIDEEYAAISGDQEARKAVMQALYDGADAIKVMVDVPGGRSLSLGELKVIVEESHRAGRRVAAHALSDLAARTAIDAGVDSIEHGYRIDESTMKAIAARAIPLVLTESTDENDEVRRRAFGILPERVGSGKSRRTLRVESALRAGVRIAFGSDSYYRMPTWSRGATALTGLEAYRNAGMNPIEVIRTATTNAADLLGMEKEVGSIEAGKYADIIGFEGDPLAGSAELRRVRFVMKGGQVIRKP